MKSFLEMQIALNLANEAFDKNEVPVGCVITDELGNIIAQAHNLVETNCDVTAHAEMLAIKEAQKNILKNNPHNNRLENCNLYVTLEPCPMCAQAIANARIKRVYYGALDEKSGGIDNGAKIFDASSCHHKPEVYSGIMEDKCKEILKSFFKKLR